MAATEKSKAARNRHFHERRAGNKRPEYWHIAYYKERLFGTFRARQS